MKASRYALVGLATVVVAVVAVVATQKKPEASKTPVPHYQSAVERRVAITTGAQVSRGRDPVLVELVADTIPSGVDRLTVLTDENCAPDADGVSHCLNRVRFTGPTGAGEPLRHYHRMAEESCLTPGETVTLIT